MWTDCPLITRADSWFPASCSAIAVIISVTAVLIFGEIIPSALFSGPNQLRITSNLSGFVWVRGCGGSVHCSRAPWAWT